MKNWRWEAFREGCGTCKFAGPINQHGSGLCRRSPPVLLVVSCAQNGGTDQVEQHQPWMAESDWCGEYQRETPQK